MSYHIRIAKPAQTDIREIYRYIAYDLQNPAAAENRISLIDKKIMELETIPTRYPLVQDMYLASKGFRVVAAKTHLIFFVIREDSLNEPRRVLVMRVLYCRRDWARILKHDTEQEGDLHC
ncbi:MAG: type II toxin-antitoxin system RelE/ParE family toxin [Defluviitaleaceae bacterium]|nr:type II toxin-antitoxin system RelE/ParE family toxin [Defluviitaleaceae bacterium]